MGSYPIMQKESLTHSRDHIPPWCFCAGQTAVRPTPKILLSYDSFLGFIDGSVVKNPPAVQEMQVRSLGWEDSLEKEMATHSSILSWKVPWTKSLGGYSPWGRRVDTTEHAHSAMKNKHSWGSKGEVHTFFQLLLLPAHLCHPRMLRAFSPSYANEPFPCPHPCHPVCTSTCLSPCPDPFDQSRLFLSREAIRGLCPV